MPHKISIIDKDGNQSEVTLPDFAMDSTQERLIKSVQALGKMNPKTAKAYEDLIDATKKAVTATEDASDQQKKDAKALQDTVQNVGDKQVSALRQFRMNFADRVGKDMRDTFTAGGNILTAAIKTATVGLAAGAGLLYKTFMDTSEAFRSLAQSGLGGAGASGTEAQDAVAELTRLGMSAGEAASMITSFGRASAVLGKANFSKFVAGVANAGSFAADLGLTLEEAAEYAAEELEMRQAGLVGRLRLDNAQSQSVMEAIQATQLLAGIMGKSMKDINASGKNFVENNAALANFLNTLPEHMRETVTAQFTSFGKEVGAIGDDFGPLAEKLMRGSLLLEPMQDANIRAMYSMGTGGAKLADIFVNAGKQVRATGQFTDEQRKSVMMQAMDVIKRYNMEEADLISNLIGKGNQFAEAFSNSSTEVAQSAENLRKYFDAVRAGQKAENDPMVKAAAAFRNVLGRITGEFTTFRNGLLGQFAEPLTKLMNNISLSGKDLEQYNQQRINAINADKDLTEQEKQERIKALRTKSVFQTLEVGLGKIATSFMNKFFPNLNAAGDGVGTFVDMVVTKVNEIVTGISDFIDGLEGDTTSEKIIDAISKGIGLLFEKGVSIVWASIKNIVANHWDSLLGAIGILMTASLAKTALFAGVDALWNKMTRGASTTATSSIKSAGNALALAIRQVAMAVRRAGRGLGVGGPMGSPGGGSGGGGGRGRRGMRLDRLAGKASVVGIGTSIVGGLASDALYDAGHEKTAAAVDTGANVLGMAGTGAMIGSFFGPAGTLIGGGIGAAAGLGMSLYQNWDTWFGSDEAEKAIAEKGEEAIEGIDETGMAAMAMDPIHIANVGYALDQFNKVSVDNIATGLSEFNPKLAELFTNIQNVKTQFVDIVSNRLERLFTIITGLNDQGERLPTTTEHLTGLANKITSMPIDSIVKLADAFSALTRALRGFGDLTTSNVFSRMWDSFSGKQDTTEDVIKVLNNFADKVDSDKLLEASQALMAFNAGMLGYAQPVEVQRTNVTAAQQADSVNDAASAGMNPQAYNPFAKTEEQLRLIRDEMVTANDTLRKIRDYTNPQNPNR